MDHGYGDIRLIMWTHVGEHGVGLTHSKTILGVRPSQNGSQRSSGTTWPMRQGTTIGQRGGIGFQLQSMNPREWMEVIGKRPK